MARKSVRSRVAAYRTSPDPAKVGPLLRDAGFRGSDDDPVSVAATIDAAGNPLRVSARYENGWRCEMRLRKDRTYTLTQSFTMRVSPKVSARG